MGNNTPGPWDVIDDGGMTPYVEAVRAGRRVTVATVEHVPDAYLIAAAPALYELAMALAANEDSPLHTLATELVARAHGPRKPGEAAMGAVTSDGDGSGSGDGNGNGSGDG